jgi:hypothetical protein
MFDSQHDLVPGLFNRGVSKFTKMFSKKDEEQVYSDLLIDIKKIKELLKDRVTAYEQYHNKDTKLIYEKSVAALDKPCGNFFSVSGQSQAYCFELDHSLKSTCSRFGDMIKNSQNIKIDNKLVCLTALHSICDTIIYYTTPDFDISNMTAYSESLFNAVNDVLFNRMSFK